MAHLDSFNTQTELQVGNRTLRYFSLPKFAEASGVDIKRLPYSLKVLLENLLRCEDGKAVSRQDVLALAGWQAKVKPSREIAFHPARVVLQDFTGVPAVVDLAAMRDAMATMGGDPEQINPLFPSELVIDHSVQVDSYGSADSLLINAKNEFERNQERYQLLRWGQKAFSNFDVVPPDTGIVHQVNVEYLARIVFDANGLAYPDTLVGTDSHTTMINGVGVLGWGVGGIEAEAAMLGQPINLLIPEVVGFKLHGKLTPGVTATDVVLTITEQLRKKGVVGKFVEFYGQGLSSLSWSDRSTIANMSPEFGSTCAIFPIDAETVQFIRFSGRTEEHAQRVEAYAKAQGMFRSDDTPDPEYTDTLQLDLSTVVTSLAGPKRPQDRVPLSDIKRAWGEAQTQLLQATGQAGDAKASAPVQFAGSTFDLRHGSVVIAAITSCTNTSNPSVMIGAGLLARNAVRKGLSTKPWVKTSLAPGSQVVTEYLTRAGLLSDLEALKFHVVGYGCTTCIGNSGPLPEPVAKAVQDHDLVVAAVLSGNRNFEGRINPLVRANYLASPPLVVAYALVGTMDFDFESEALGKGKDGKPVFLRDVWPSTDEIRSCIAAHLDSEMFRTKYADVYQGDAAWQSLKVPDASRFDWDPESTYVRHPTFFSDMPAEPPALQDIQQARVLVMLGDSVTTDHISPAGSIATRSPAGQYLAERGVSPRDFNSYGARRGNHEVMVRGTFANVRLRNQLVPGVEGGYTRHLPDAATISIFEASELYQKQGAALIVLGGKEYGSGSSRDWAAKGTYMLGVKAVLAESFERIHRSNLIGMGVVPLQYQEGSTRESLGLSGEELYDVTGIARELAPGKLLTVTATDADGTKKSFPVLARIDTLVELEYYNHGGILQYVLRQLLRR